MDIGDAQLPLLVEPVEDPIVRGLESEPGGPPLESEAEPVAVDAE